MEKASSKIKARHFLKTGIIGSAEVDRLAVACDREIQAEARRSVKSALKLARRFVRVTEGMGGTLELSAARVLARVTHLGGRHAEALTAYLKARRLARKDPVIRGRIDRALIDVYMYLGNHEEAALAARRSLATFKKIKSQADLARTRVNYANLLHRRDRHRDAEKLYSQAADFFKTSGERLAEAKCNFNRANTLVQLFDLKEAERLYRISQKIYEIEKLTLDACDARYGLAWLRMLTGRFHVALMELTECEKIYRAAGDVRGELLCSLDRAEVYLSLGLYSDALEAARYSERRFSNLNLRYEQSKAAFFRGQAAAAIGNQGQARTALKRARQGFLRDRNFGFLGASCLLAADLAGSNRTTRRRNLTSARRMFSKAQLPLWSAVCDLQETFDPNRVVSALRRLSRNRAALEVPYLYAYWQTSCGDYEMSRGNVDDARKHWTRAADRLDAIRSQLPPVELRSSFGQSRDLPHRRLIKTELEHNIMQAAVWSERYKTAGVWSPLRLDKDTLETRRSIGESLDNLARQISSLAHNLSTSFGERKLDTNCTGKKLARLQKQVREKLITIENNNVSGPLSLHKLISAIKETSCHLPVVQFHLQTKDILAFVHVNGESRLVRYRNAVPRLHHAMRCWRFILEDELLVGHFGRNAEMVREESLWTELGQWLWEPLKIESDHRQVLIIPEGELANLPWPALIVQNQSLINRHRFIISPSIGHYLAALTIRTRSKKIRIYKGITNNLPHADNEIRCLRHYFGKAASIHSPVHRSDWPDNENARIWHFTGHAHLRADNPFYSSLMLDDGPLFATDFRLKQCRVDLVTLAACRSGEQIALPGEEMNGLVRSLLEMGARSVIAGLWPVDDESTSLWVRTFYKKLIEGDDLLDAYTHASLTVKRKFPSAYNWAAFSVFGAGHAGVNYAN